MSDVRRLEINTQTSIAITRASTASSPPPLLDSSPPRSIIGPIPSVVVRRAGAGEKSSHDDAFPRDMTRGKLEVNGTRRRRRATVHATANATRDSTRERRRCIDDDDDDED